MKFGTAGVRAKMGPGPDEINKGSIERLAQAHANVLKRRGGKSVLIAYDVRHMSRDLARWVGGVFIANDLKLYISPGPMATPLASFAMRKLKTDGGVVITASHNPRDYNGYKAYDSYGGQILDPYAKEIQTEQESLEESMIKAVDLEEALEDGRAEYIGQDVYNSYLETLKSTVINRDIDKNISIVYSPLNGTGRDPLVDIFAREGFDNLHIVESQAFYDGDFDGLDYPNPEFDHVFTEARDLGKAKSAHILIATDPDADRLGLMVKNGEDYTYLSGNELGPLIFDYIASNKAKLGKLGKNPYMVKTVVTGDLVQRICVDYNIRLRESLTGFKNIAEIMEEEYDANFIFAFEEAIGYLTYDGIRDKDGIGAGILVAEMAAYYKTLGYNLLDVLEGLYDKYGYVLNKQIAIAIDGDDGQEKLKTILKNLMDKPIECLGNEKLSKAIDFNSDQTGLAKTNMFKFYYGDSWICTRPSGTEPKLKFYINASANTRKEAETILAQAEEQIKAIVNPTMG